MYGAKEMREDMLQQEAEERAEYAARPLQEEREYKGRHCSRCGTNWARLHTIDEEGDEQYDFCPVCKTDTHLEAAQPGPWFTFCPFTGQKIDVDTGKPGGIEISEPPGVAPYTGGFNPDRYYKRLAERHAIEDKAIDAYLKTYETEGPSAAQEAFHKHKFSE